MKFKDELKAEIARLGWTQTKTASFLSVSLSTVEKWLNGSRVPSERTRKSVLEDLKQNE